MSDTDFYLAERLMDLRVQEERHQARLRRFQREARSAHSGWLSCQSRWLLRQVDSLFVSLGVRLLHTGLPQPRPVGQQMHPK